MPDSTNEAVTWRVAKKGVVVVAMQHPPANALGTPIIEGLSAALDAVESAGDVKVVIIASNIPKVFAAGADIKHMSNIDATSFTAYGDKLRSVLDRLAGSDRIAIAAIDGLALGGGLELAMACTMRVGGAEARFGLPEVQLGLIPGAGGTQRLPRLVGRGRALDIMLTARKIPADEAKAIGLIDRLVGAGNAEAAALELADTLTVLSQPALMTIIRTVDAAFDLPLKEGFAFEIAQEQDLFEDGEAREGLSSFLEKRQPNFK